MITEEQKGILEEFLSIDISDIFKFINWDALEKKFMALRSYESGIMNKKISKKNLRREFDFITKRLNAKNCEKDEKFCE